MIDAPLLWLKPRRIFVNSMSDLFHNDVPDAYIRKVFDTMSKASWHQYQVLTKRSERLRTLAPRLDWPAQIWMGVTVESDKYVHRIDDLRSTPAKVKFLSLEPLLSALPKLNLKGIDWAIVGGESGPGARPMNPSWPIDLRDQCQKAHVAFFFKQWGGINKKRTGRVLAGRTWDQFPASSRSSERRVSLPVLVS